MWPVKLHAVFGLLIYTSFLFDQPVFAQLCVNPSSQLVINQTFGTARQPASLAGLTPYQYVPPTCPADGQYTVTETIDGGCFNYTWYAVAADHTPDDTDGNMMIVNAANTAGVFYEQPVSGLCPGTTYEFSLWVVNLLKTGICPTPLIPDLSVRVETKNGQVLASAPIGTVSLTDKPTWRYYSALFTAPKTKEELVIKLINNKGEYGCGNDMVIDDIQLKACEVCASEQVYVPDVFTPNNDGMNDDLAFFLPKVASYTLKVFNRWGNVIFSSTDLNQKWDGTYAGNPCETGDYTWIISYRSASAGQESDSYVQTGHVLLMR
jgi:gliding motility-associated-like protein